MVAHRRRRGGRWARRAGRGPGCATWAGLEIAALTQQVTDLRTERELQGTVDRAVGAVIAERRTSAEGALTHLRDRALAEGTDVGSVAEAVLHDLGPAGDAGWAPVAGSGDTRVDPA